MAPTTNICLSCRMRLWSHIQVPLRSNRTILRHIPATRSMATPARCLQPARLQYSVVYPRTSGGQRAYSTSPKRSSEATSEESKANEMLILQLQNALIERGVTDSKEQAMLIEEILEQSQESDNAEGSEGANESRRELEDSDELQLAQEVFEDARANLDPADVARAARQRFGDSLPQEALRPEEYKAYERLYGTPAPWTQESEMTDEEISRLAAEQEQIQKDASHQLQQEDSTGTWEEFEHRVDMDELNESDDAEQEMATGDGTHDLRLQHDIQLALEAQREQDVTEGGSSMTEEGEDSHSDQSRSHPFTLAGRSGTYPSTITLPFETLAAPTIAMLADVPNKHLDQAAERLFGGPGLPYSTGTPLSSRILPQKPIPLTANQQRMSSIDADVWMAALGPGVYASVMSVLVELRRRLGTQWLQELLLKPEGPSILDAGSGGVGILAWREVIKAEWARMKQDPSSPVCGSEKAAPLGRSTVLTASDALRLRSSLLLDDTTFLPRLPDYVHVADKTSTQRKQFDIVIAPHTLWEMKEDLRRRQHVENLWSLTSAQGGVLVILEKGVPRGFEVVADARNYLLRSLFAPDVDEADIVSDRRRHAGNIVAPCTNEEKCPMYPVPGVSQQRKDYCHFVQRYTRPTYYQRLLGAANRNYEDVRYSYVAVRKGQRRSDLTSDTETLSGDAATNRAFTGYGLGDEDLRVHEAQEWQPEVTIGEPYAEGDKTAPNVLVTPEPKSRTPDPKILPRILLSPLKRRGHVIMDVCTPSGTLERWTVTRSFDRQAFRDARKARWGDLWALGAKIRIPRGLRLGKLSDKKESTEEKEGQTGERRETKARGRAKAKLRKQQVRKAFAKEEKATTSGAL